MTEPICKDGRKPKHIEPLKRNRSYQVCLFKRLHVGCESIGWDQSSFRVSCLLGRHHRGTRVLHRLQRRETPSSLSLRSLLSLLSRCLRDTCARRLALGPYPGWLGEGTGCHRQATLGWFSSLLRSRPRAPLACLARGRVPLLSRAERRRLSQVVVVEDVSRSHEGQTASWVATNGLLTPCGQRHEQVVPAGCSLPATSCCFLRAPAVMTNSRNAADGRARNGSLRGCCWPRREASQRHGGPLGGGWQGVQADRGQAGGGSRLFSWGLWSLLSRKPRFGLQKEEQHVRWAVSPFGVWEGNGEGEWRMHRFRCNPCRVGGPSPGTPALPLGLSPSSPSIPIRRAPALLP